MKKPEITKGEWIYSKGQITEQEGYAIAEYVSEHDGQAISAVPEMIDALVDAHGTLESLTYSGADKFVVEEELKKIEQALKKAGCV